MSQSLHSWCILRLHKPMIPVEQSESGCLLSSHADWGSEQDSSIMLMSGAVSRGWIWTSAHTMA